MNSMIKYSFRLFLTYSLVYSIVSSATCFAFPVKLLRMQYKHNGFEKDIFFIGDVHSRQKETTRSGKELLRTMDQFFPKIHTIIPPNNKLSIIWEIAPNLSKRKNSRIYLNHKINSLLNGPFPKFKIIASDQLRNSSKKLKTLMLNTLYRPTVLKNQLADQTFRHEIAYEIKKTLIPPQGNLLERKLSYLRNKSLLPKNIANYLGENLEWYRHQVSYLHSSLFFCPQNLVVDSSLEKYRQVLAKNTADLEMLLNIFSSKKNTLVYAGNGHIKRIQRFLYKLGFQSKFEIENYHFLSKRDVFQFFLQYKKSVKSKTKSFKKPTKTNNNRLLAQGI